MDWDADVGAVPLAGLPEGISVAQLVSMMVWSTVLVVTLFGGLVAAAMLLRRRPEHTNA